MKTKAVALRLTDTEIAELEKRAAGKKIQSYIKEILFPVNKPSLNIEEPAPVPSSPAPKIPEKILEEVKPQEVQKPVDPFVAAFHPNEGRAMLQKAMNSRMSKDRRW